MEEKAFVIWCASTLGSAIQFWSAGREAGSIDGEELVFLIRAHFGSPTRSHSLLEGVEGCPACERRHARRRAMIAEPGETVNRLSTGLAISV